MPLLYGEGTRAFRRLQEAIIAKSDDETIFAVNNESGLLATDPSEFSAQPMIRTALCAGTENRGFLVVQAGVRMRVSYLDMGERVWAVVFNCKYASLDRPCIRLFQAEQKKFEFQTTRLYITGGDVVLRKAYERLADNFSSRTRKDVYQHEEAILMSESSSGLEEGLWTWWNALSRRGSMSRASHQQQPRDDRALQ